MAHPKNSKTSIEAQHKQTQAAVDVAEEILECLESSTVALGHLKSLLYAVTQLGRENPHHENLVELAWYYAQEASDRSTYCHKDGELKLEPVRALGSHAHEQPAEPVGASEVHS